MTHRAINDWVQDEAGQLGVNQILMLGATSVVLLTLSGFGERLLTLAEERLGTVRKMAADGEFTDLANSLTNLAVTASEVSAEFLLPPTDAEGPGAGASSADANNVETAVTMDAFAHLTQMLVAPEGTGQPTDAVEGTVADPVVSPGENSSVPLVGGTGNTVDPSPPVNLLPASSENPSGETGTPAKEEPESTAEELKEDPQPEDPSVDDETVDASSSVSEGSIAGFDAGPGYSGGGGLGNVMGSGYGGSGYPGAGYAAPGYFPQTYPSQGSLTFGNSAGSGPDSTANDASVGSELPSRENLQTPLPSTATTPAAESAVASAATMIEAMAPVPSAPASSLQLAPNFSSDSPPVTEADDAAYEEHHQSDSDAAAIEIIGIDRSDPNQPRLRVRVHREFRQLQVRINRARRGYRSPQPQVTHSIPLHPQQLVPGQRIEIIGVESDSYCITEYTVPEYLPADDALTDSDDLTSAGTPSFSNSTMQLEEE